MAGGPWRNHDRIALTHVCHQFRERGPIGVLAGGLIGESTVKLDAGKLSIGLLIKRAYPYTAAINSSNSVNCGARRTPVDLEQRCYKPQTRQSCPAAQAVFVHQSWRMNLAAIR